MIAAPIAVWRVDLDGFEVDGDGPWSPAERERAARFRTETLRRRWLAGRAALRGVLSLHLGCRAEEVPLETGERGRPRLARVRGAAASLDFNVSHSEHLFLCAVNLRGRVGVDVERMRPLEDLPELAALALPPRARGLVERARGEEAQRAFFRAWTAREALAKCLGRGLDLPLEDLGACARGLEIVELGMKPGFAAALAAPAPVLPIEIRDWEGSPARR